MAAPLRQVEGFFVSQSINLNYLASLKKFSDQLGGHGELLSMDEEDSIIVKPCNGIERDFYENSIAHPGFARWMPKYYGTLRLHDSQPPLLDQQLDVNNNIISCDIKPQTTKESIVTHADVKDAEEAICIENVLSKFKKPCVMDLKLGTQLWGEDADERKRQKAILKAERTTSSSMGIYITACRVYGKSSNNYTYYSREYCRNLTPITIIKCFADFFMAEISPSQRQLVINRFIEDLTSFLEALEKQDVRLRSASLLFVYEGDPNAFTEALNKEEEETQDNQKTSKLTSGEDYVEDEDIEDTDYDSDIDEDDDDEFKVTELKIIDFAHSYFRDGVGKDEGCLLGVNNAIRCLKQVLNEITN
ncbi:SAICAR synthase-like protein [Gigaspora margarita]|uniref:Kinase n=1 Tax=Gigaspora margarita TaxID=4874 RepID=A0A8H3X5M3_GIGMA|nr:SAICAR synthase-like protein [Gigaspora margarita]